MNQIFSWQTVDQLNIAEQVCRPTDYFPEWNATVLEQGCCDADLEKGPIIFGASGLLYPEIAPRLEYAATHSTHTLIAWGIGHNTHYGDHIEYPRWLKRFSLVGLRDTQTHYELVPCPSCLHPSFDAPPLSPEHELVIYDQKDYPVNLHFDSIPRMSNEGGKDKMDAIVRFLASGASVLTSSYHGAYWSLLLGRRVFLWKPWSTKFFSLLPKMEMLVSETTNHIELVKDRPAKVYSRTYLDECRGANYDFADRVAMLLGVPSPCKSTQSSN